MHQHEPSRRQPDWYRIADLERDLYGETFYHDGSPVPPSRAEPKPPPAPVKLADLCPHCHTDRNTLGPQYPGGRLCPDCQELHRALMNGSQRHGALLAAADAIPDPDSHG